MCKSVGMTLDERFEFLAKNIESLHEAVFENTRQIAQHQEQIVALTRAVSSIANTVSDLALIARDHQRRLTNLEGGVQ
jgi:uncharacterized coiled-coil protein SlyX